MEENQSDSGQNPEIVTVPIDMPIGELQGIVQISGRDLAVKLSGPTIVLIEKGSKESRNRFKNLIADSINGTPSVEFVPPTE